LFSDLDYVKNIYKFFNQIGGEIISIELNKINNDFRSLYFMNSTIIMLENLNIIIFIGINIRIELPLINSRIRKAILMLNNKIKLFSVGFSNSYNNLPIKFFGNCVNDIINMLKGKNIINCNLLFNNIYNNVFMINKNFNIKILLGSSLYNMVPELVLYMMN
jgi:hypothetical protein